MPSPLRSGDLVLDLVRHQARRGGEAVALTRREVELLRYLAERAGRPVSQDELHREVWHHAPRVRSRAVDFAVHRLRQKIEVDPSSPRVLVTVVGAGYQLDLDPPELRQGPRLVGRDEDLAHLRDRLLEARLVTLLGPAGVGKTSVARVAVATWPTEALVVDLSVATGAEQLHGAVAVALGLARLGHAPIAELAEVLASRGALLLALDNLEQLVEPAAEAVRVWLDEAPALRVLGTSRTALRLPGEHIVPLAPLSGAAARTLLLQRAEASRPGWADGVADAVLTDLVDRLDRLPLALELAAARSPILSPTELAERLGSRFRTLARGRRGASDRQSSLWGALMWSWDLLPPDERQTLVALSVFRGGFDLSAAEAVVGEHALDGVHALWEQSLLVRGEPADRFDMLLSIQAFAAAQDDATLARARDAHLAWALALATACGRRWLDNGDSDAMEALERESDNILAALEHAPPPERARLLLASEPLWLARGPIDPLLARLSASLDEVRDDGLRARLLNARARARASFLRSGREDAEQALAVARTLDDDEQVFEAMLTLAIIARTRGELDEAMAWRDALRPALHPSTGEGLRLRVTLNQANIHHAAGQLDQAEAAYRDAAALARELGHRKAQGTIELNLAVTRASRDDHAGQARLAAQALEHLRQARDRRLEGGALLCLGSAQLRLGDWDQAAQTLDDAWELCRDTGDRGTRAEVDLTRAMLCMCLGDDEPARLHADRAASALEALGHAQALGEAVYVGACARWLLGTDREEVLARLDQAIALLDEAPHRGTPTVHSKRSGLAALLGRPAPSPVFDCAETIEAAVAVDAGLVHVAHGALDAARALLRPDDRRPEVALATRILALELDAADP